MIEGIDEISSDGADMMGDVYEYMLGIMAASGTNGQFRTPRHIIRMMVELMRPTLDDTICDPAMGSARFLSWKQPNTLQSIKVMNCLILKRRSVPQRDISWLGLGRFHAPHRLYEYDASRCG